MLNITYNTYVNKCTRVYIHTHASTHMYMQANARVHTHAHAHAQQLIELLWWSVNMSALILFWIRYYKSFITGIYV